MSQSIFEQYDIFKTMHPIKIQIMKEHNLSFTPEESSLLIEILTKDMSPQEKEKVEMMKNIIGKNGRTF